MSKKITIVGAGIVGIATACYLRREGHEVTVVTMHPPGEYCSFGNAGMLNNGGCVPQAVPGVLWKVPGYLTDPLGPLVVRWSYFAKGMPWMLRFLASATASQAERASIALYSLIRDTVPSYEELVKWAGTPDLVRRSGYLVAYESEKSYQGDALAWKLRRERGVRTELLDAAGIRKLVPQLAPGYVRGVHVLEQGYVANPGRLVKSLAAQFQRDGGTLLERQVLDIETVEGGVVALLTSAGRMPVETLVVCAGVHSGELTAMLGEAVPIEAERGYHVTYSDPGLQLPLPVHVSDAKVFVTPMEMGVRVAGQAEFSGIYAEPDYQRADVLETHMKRMFPQVRTTDATRWMGRRPSMPDSLPVIGPSAKQKNVFYAFGHGHLGLCAGASTGRLVADLVGGRRPAIDLTPFRINRF
ncbi:MAG: FAD-dependent oxidoreductase [Betaproteobacteria bacterium]|nr:FAD-dependent oxidoreductase [Betaproteobacteria bacterium]